MSRNSEHITNRMISLPDTDLTGLLTVDELAELLKVPKSWVYEHTRKRGSQRLPHIKLGKYLRFFEHQVREFLESKFITDAP